MENRSFSSQENLDGNYQRPQRIRRPCVEVLRHYYRGEWLVNSELVGPHQSDGAIEQCQLTA